MADPMGRRRFESAAISFLAASLAAAATDAQTSEDPAADAFVAWAAEVAIPFELEGAVAPETLAPLVDGKRVVYLGEPDHFIHQKYAFRLRFLTALLTLPRFGGHWT